MEGGSRSDQSGLATRTCSGNWRTAVVVPERLTTIDHTNNPSSFSPDGQLLAFIEIHPTTGQDLWVLRLSDRKAQPFLRTQSKEVSPMFKPSERQAQERIQINVVLNWSIGFNHLVPVK